MGRNGPPPGSAGPGPNRPRDLAAVAAFALLYALFTFGVVLWRREVLGSP